MSTERTNVAIVGMGTVGTGVARILLDHSDRTAIHAGRTLSLEKVVVNNTSKVRELQLPTGVMTDSLDDVTSNPNIDVVAQLVGGIEPARTIMRILLESGKDVVTANKALLAEHGPELFDLARKLGRSIAFEASVAGGVPIVTGIGQCLTANQITSLSGILNGTSNFIVSEMEGHNAAYADAVHSAQELGYAEADPTMDVDGTDAVQKLAILAHLAFGARVSWKDIPKVGIDSLTKEDIAYAKELGYRVKLLAVAQLAESDNLQAGLDLHVSPTLVRAGTPLAEVRGANNAISVVGDAVGRVFFHGLGAGQMPTASAVVADLIDMAVGRTQLTFQTLQLWSDREARVAMRDPRLCQSRYYLRLLVQDHPGVLAKVAGILGNHNISIASVIQHEPAGENVPLVIMTHHASEGEAAEATGELDALEWTKENTVRMRVMERRNTPRP